MDSWQRLNWLKIRAWSVHFYTSLGLITGFLALAAIVANNAKLAFLWLGIALVIDATDGTFARKYNVSLWTPGFDGRKLDDITDYLNYAFIPVFFIWHFELINGILFLILPVVLLSAVYGFCQSGAKTDDGYFTGFPNFWNLVVVYLFIFDWSQMINGIILIILAMLVFVPIKFVSFSTPGKVRLVKSLALVYFVLLVMIILFNSSEFAYLSLIFPLLYLGYALFQKISTNAIIVPGD
jgi:phosphatidylcholine synthase